MPSPQEREAALFQAAAQLSGAERIVFLNGACHGDPALRQRLDALLAAQDQPDSLPVKAAPAAKATIKLDLAPEPPDEAVGQTLGRYKLLERVGEGGCGVVYVAEQTQPVRRRVALKVIKLGMDTKAGCRPVRGGAAGSGHDGSSQHRQGARCGHDRDRSGTGVSPKTTETRARRPREQARRLSH